MTTGQTLKSAEFKWYRINDAGREVEYFNTKLENVKLVKVNPKMHDIKDPAFEKHNHLEQIELRYEKITWTYKDGNIIHSDSGTNAPPRKSHADRALSAVFAQRLYARTLCKEKHNLPARPDALWVPE